MNIDRAVLRIAGIVVLASLLLGIFVSEYWFFLTGLVGLNMLQASFTGFCPAAIVLRKLGVQSGAAF
jgi:hypothetical protein